MVYSIATRPSQRLRVIVDPVYYSKRYLCVYCYLLYCCRHFPLPRHFAEMRNDVLSFSQTAVQPLPPSLPPLRERNLPRRNMRALLFACAAFCLLMQRHVCEPFGTNLILTKSSIFGRSLSLSLSRSCLVSLRCLRFPSSSCLGSSLLRPPPPPAPTLLTAVSNHNRQGSPGSHWSRPGAYTGEARATSRW